jgi:phosphoribosylglycinamide formyltransferase-1
VTQRIGLGVLISGGGTTLENLIAESQAGRLPAEVKVVISSRADAYGLIRAKNHGIDHYVVPSKKYRRVGEEPDWVGMSAEICHVLDRYEVDLIVLAGFMCQFVISPRYEGRVMNIHPALIPAFCGPGLYGHKVHEAVLAQGVKVTGCTVHFADQRYDHGPIIIQRPVPVLDDDTPETLAQRVFAQECIAYPEAIRLFAEGRLKVEGRRVLILAPDGPPAKP